MSNNPSLLNEENIDNSSENHNELDGETNHNKSEENDELEKIPEKPKKRGRKKKTSNNLQMNISDSFSQNK